MKIVKSTLVNYIALILFAFIIIAFCKELKNYAELMYYGVTTDAVVTDNEVDEHLKNNPDYDVKYEFRTHNSNTVYSYVGGWNEKNAWCSVIKSEYKKVIKSKQIHVVYLPSNPWNNDAKSEWTMFNLIKGYSIGGTIILFSILVIKFNICSLRKKIKSNRKNRGNGCDCFYK